MTADTIWLCYTLLVSGTASPVPGFSHLQSCSQIWREKAWESWSRAMMWSRQRVDTQGCSPNRSSWSPFLHIISLQGLEAWAFARQYQYVPLPATPGTGWGEKLGHHSLCVYPLFTWRHHTWSSHSVTAYHRNIPNNTFEYFIVPSTNNNYKGQ